MKTTMMLMSVALLSGCGSVPNECARQEAKILITAAALDQCASTPRCIVTSESVVALYEGVLKFQTGCPAPKAPPPTEAQLLEHFERQGKAERGEPM